MRRGNCLGYIWSPLVGKMNSRSQNTACGVKRIDVAIVVARDKKTGLRQSFCRRRVAREGEPLSGDLCAGDLCAEPFLQRGDRPGAVSPHRGSGARRFCCPCVSLPPARGPAGPFLPRFIS